ncbi:MAG: zinc-binding alcohol dehydrogenase family protein, partial [Schlesneria sp.]
SFIMHALVTSPPGGWPNTQLTQIELREGRPADVLVRIHAVGLNPADNFQIEGKYPGGPKPPFISGRDACGVVVRGDSFGKWQPGDAVVVLQSSTTDLTNGTLCEQQWIAAENLAGKPEGWTDAEAAAAPLVFHTAWKALFDLGGLTSGQSVVITGASGGVGLAAVQLANSVGATVVALSRSDAKRSQLHQIGAHHVFAPDDPHLKEKICDAVKAKGVSLVIENVGGTSLATSVHLLSLHGRVSVVGVLGGVEGTVPIPALMFKRASIHGVLVTDDTPQQAQSAWEQIVALMERTGSRPIIDHRFPLEEVAAAFEKLRDNVFGKVIVEIPPASK